MFCLATRTANSASRASSVRSFPWLAATIVYLCLLAAFRIGIDLGFRDIIGQGNWGRILFGIGTAITQMDHGGYGYAMSNVIETVLKYGGLTCQPAVLGTRGVQIPPKFPGLNLHKGPIGEA